MEKFNEVGHAVEGIGFRFSVLPGRQKISIAELGGHAPSGLTIPEQLAHTRVDLTVPAAEALLEYLKLVVPQQPEAAATPDTAMTPQLAFMHDLLAITRKHGVYLKNEPTILTKGRDGSDLLAIKDGIANDPNFSYDFAVDEDGNILMEYDIFSRAEVTVI